MWAFDSTDHYINQTFKVNQKREHFISELYLLVSTDLCDVMFLCAKCWSVA